MFITKQTVIPVLRLRLPPPAIACGENIRTGRGEPHGPRKQWLGFELPPHCGKKQVAARLLRARIHLVRYQGLFPPDGKDGEVGSHQLT